MSTDTTDFGFQRVATGEKARRVGEVFSSVSGNYDLMNDLMSLGIHRLWKRYAVHLSAARSGQQVLDVAGGTGDMARLFHRRVGDTGLVLVSDINRDMLQLGRRKLHDRGIARGVSYVQSDAENLPFTSNYFDCVCIAFGLRNVTDKAAALHSMYEKTKYGGRLIVLEFSSVVLPFLQKLYDAYSFHLIPWLGKYVASDEAGYRYLVESIRMHPDQETLKQMMLNAGFARVDYHNLTGGVVAIPRGYKL